MNSEELCFLPAYELAALIRSRQVSAIEVMDAHIAQTERLNPQVNAIVTFLPERARADARAADAALARGEAPGVLAGLPVAHKDLTPTKGIRTTFGSPIFRDFVPDADAIIVEPLSQSNSRADVHCARATASSARIVRGSRHACRGRTRGFAAAHDTNVTFRARDNR